MGLGGRLKELGGSGVSDGGNGDVAVAGGVSVIVGSAVGQDLIGSDGAVGLMGAPLVGDGVSGDWAAGMAAQAGGLSVLSIAPSSAMISRLVNKTMCAMR